MDNGDPLPAEIELFHELMAYTLAHADPRFIHQHAVDAFAVQNASAKSKPIAVVFGLIGLYLHLERGFTGRQVQRAHMQLGTPRRTWTPPPFPEARGKVRVAMWSPRRQESSAMRQSRSGVPLCGGRGRRITAR